MVDRVKVYAFRVWDPEKWDTVIGKRKATLAFIERVRGEAISSSEEEVSAADLDDEGRYHSKGQLTAAS